MKNGTQITRENEEWTQITRDEHEKEETVFLFFAILPNQRMIYENQGTPDT